MGRKDMTVQIWSKVTMAALGHQIPMQRMCEPECFTDMWIMMRSNLEKCSFACVGRLFCLLCIFSFLICLSLDKNLQHCRKRQADVVFFFIFFLYSIHFNILYQWYIYDCCHHVFVCVGAWGEVRWRRWSKTFGKFSLVTLMIWPGWMQRPRKQLRRRYKM